MSFSGRCPIFPLTKGGRGMSFAGRCPIFPLTKGGRGMSFAGGYIAGG